MKTISQSKANRNAIRAIVSEHFLDEEIRNASIQKMPEKQEDEIIEHGIWRFVYDRKSNVIFLEIE